MENNNIEYGEVKISDDVVETIASLAASEVKGVCSLTGGLTSDFVEKLSKKKYSKGVKVDVTERDVNVSLYLILEYGVNVVEVAEKVQENVKQQIELMTGLNVVEVNVFVQGVKIVADDTQSAKAGSEA